jgi:hypothetical protein
VGWRWRYPPRHFRQVKALSNINLLFENTLWRGSLLISYEKYIKDGKVLAHLGFPSKILSGPLPV